MANSKSKLQGILRRDYGMTPRQAELAVAFLNTASIAKSADRIGVKNSTGNQYMKTIYTRTKRHNQADLMKFLLKLSQAEHNEGTPGMRKLITKKTGSFVANGADKPEAENYLLNKWMKEINDEGYRVISFDFARTGNTCAWAHFICELEFPC